MYRDSGSPRAGLSVAREDVMPESNWRRPEHYAELKDVNAAGFAWEFLRRNPDYAAEASAILRLGVIAPSALDEFSQRWGLSFRGGSRARRHRGAAVLARGRERLRRSPGAIT
jgi:hypothetical protein